MKNYAALIKREAGTIVLVCLIYMLTTATSLALPYLMSSVIDSGINELDFDFVLRTSLLMIAVAAAGFILSVVAKFFESGVMSRFCAGLREKVFKKTQSLTLEQFEQIGTGTLVSRSTQDVNMIAFVLSLLMSGALTLPVLFFGGVALSFSKDVMLSLIFFAFAPFVIVLVVLLGKIIVPLYKRTHFYQDKQNTTVRQRLQGIRIIRAFIREKNEHSKTERDTKVMVQSFIRANTTMGILNPFSSLILNLTTLLIVYFGARKMENPSSIISAGDIMAIIQYVGLTMQALLNASHALIMIPRVKLSFSRINEVLNQENIEDFGEQNVEPLDKGVRFENVEYSYPEASTPALKNITLELEAGKKVAIIGGTGSGKTTLLKLLLGFFKPQSGSIIFGDKPIEEISPKALRENISVSMQKAAIFTGSVRANLLMGKQTATDEELWQALQVAQIEDYVQSREQKMDYELTQGGTNLSGGQKQRISIARCILKKAQIYVFDDSFSALDYLTELNLRAQLNRHFEGKTQLIITQRVASARGCDRIYVLNEGVLVGEGTHAELLEGCKIYQEIYASQAGTSF